MGYINKTQFQIYAYGGKYVLGRTSGWWAGLVPNTKLNNTIFTYDAKRYQIRSKENKCLDVLYGKTSKVGQPLVWYTCHAGANQKFKLYTVSKKVYTGAKIKLRMREVKKVIKKAKKITKAQVKSKVKKIIKRGKIIKKRVVKKSKCGIMSKNSRCGKAYGRCRSGYCSRWNWCGFSRAHKTRSQTRYNAMKGCVKKRVVKKRVVRMTSRYVKMLNIVKKYAISVFGSKFTKNTRVVMYPYKSTQRNSNWYVKYINKTQFQIVAYGGKYVLGRTT